MKLKAQAYLKLAAEDWKKKYDWVFGFSEGLAPVGLNGKYGFVDTTGKVVIPPKYDHPLKYEGLVGFNNGLARVKLNGKWGFIDTTGKEVIPPKYDYAGSFSEGLALVGLGDYETGKMGFIDVTGKEVVPLKYDWVWDFSDGLARVRLKGKMGFIDVTGKEVVPIQYTDKELPPISSLIRLGGDPNVISEQISS